MSNNFSESEEFSVESRSSKRVMISYNQKSAGELALKINEALKEVGYQTWIDLEQMQGNIRKRMAEGVSGSDVVLCFITAEYCASEFCVDECEYAKDKKKPIIPIKVNEKYEMTGSVDMICSRLLYVDFSNGDFDNCFVNLLEQVDKYCANS